MLSEIATFCGWAGDWYIVDAYPYKQIGGVVFWVIQRWNGAAERRQQRKSYLPVAGVKNH